MATVRGFVDKISVGREGLVTVMVIADGGASDNYVIRDIDGDPERFNERLSKLGILRDAMDHAEPVEIEFAEGEQGKEIRRAARISREYLKAGSDLQPIMGIVMDLSVAAENRTVAEGEYSDRAVAYILDTDLNPTAAYLDLQIPERGVALQQLDMLRDAQTHGRMVKLHVSTAETPVPRIVTISVDNSLTQFGERDTRTVDGFVESLSLIRLPFPGAGALSSSLAHVQFTTSPPFVSAGNTVELVPFTPVTIDLLVAKGSLSYELFEAGLRDNNRMRISAAILDFGRKDDEEGKYPDEDYERGNAESAAGYSAPSENLVLRMLATGRLHGSGQGLSTNAEARQVGIVAGVELLAPLASAARPVWITISRSSLDKGPDGFRCTEGTPSSDLTPSSLRDLRIPYPAVWTGIGCFNSGIYRLQFNLPVPFKVFVDGEEICLYRADRSALSKRETEAKISSELLTEVEVEKLPVVRGVPMFGHACLCGEHEIRVEIEDWTCEYQFELDVYRLR